MTDKHAMTLDQRTALIRGAWASLDNGLAVLPNLSPKPRKYPTYGYDTLPKVPLPKDFITALLSASVGYTVFLPNVAVIDCENVQAYAIAKRFFLDRDLSLFAVKSPNGGHVYFKCHSAKYLQVGTVAEVKHGYNSHVQGAGSLADDGTQYALEHADGIAELTRQEYIELLNTIADGFNLPRPTVKKRRNDRQANEYLADGALVGSRNNTLFKTLCHLYGHGDEDKAEQAIARARRDGLSAKEISATVKSAKAQIEKTATARHKPTARGLVDRPLSNGAYMTKTQSAIWLALCDLSDKHDNGRGFRATVREVSELVAVSKETTRKAFALFQSVGILKHVRTVGKGFYYTITATGTKTARRFNRNLPSGYSAVYDAISDGATTYKAVMAVARVSYDTARRAVNKLHEVGLCDIDTTTRPHTFQRADFVPIADTPLSHKQDRRRDVLISRHKSERAHVLFMALMNVVRRRRDTLRSYASTDRQALARLSFIARHNLHKQRRRRHNAMRAKGIVAEWRNKRLLVGIAS